MILILPKSCLNDQKLRILNGKKSEQNLKNIFELECWTALLGLDISLAKCAKRPSITTEGDQDLKNSAPDIIDLDEAVKTAIGLCIALP